MPSCATVFRVACMKTECTLLHVHKRGQAGASRAALALRVPHFAPHAAVYAHTARDHAVRDLRSAPPSPPAQLTPSFSGF
eukprot:4982486-Pleurochrysis_carterae.AAC.1